MFEREWPICAPCVWTHKELCGNESFGECRGVFVCECLYKVGVRQNMIRGPILLAWGESGMKASVISGEHYVIL